jgi:putative FmdB family regulatory protein
MALYDFKCVHCEHEFEKLVPMGTVQVSCPKCGAMANKKLSAPGGFDLRGDGWYKGNASKPSSD